MGVSPPHIPQSLHSKEVDFDFIDGNRKPSPTPDAQTARQPKGKSAVLTIVTGYEDHGQIMAAANLAPAPTPSRFGSPVRLNLTVVTNEGAKQEAVTLDTCSSFSAANSSFPEDTDESFEAAGPAGAILFSGRGSVFFADPASKRGDACVDVKVAMGSEKMTPSFILGHPQMRELGTTVNFSTRICTFTHESNALSGTYPLIDQGAAPNTGGEFPDAWSADDYLETPGIALRPSTASMLHVRLAYLGQVAHVDSGAVVTLIASKDHPNVVPGSFRDATVKLRSVTGGALRIVGKVNIRTSMDLTQKFTSAFVVPELCVDLLLGTDFLETAAAVISYPLQRIFMLAGPNRGEEWVFRDDDNRSPLRSTFTTRPDDRSSQ